MILWQLSFHYRNETLESVITGVPKKYIKFVNWFIRMLLSGSFYN